jgi:hypothetical protein
MSSLTSSSVAVSCSICAFIEDAHGNIKSHMHTINILKLPDILNNISEIFLLKGSKSNLLQILF